MRTKNQTPNLDKALTEIERDADFDNWPILDADGEETEKTQNILQIQLSKLQWVRELIPADDSDCQYYIDDLESILEAMIEDNKTSKKWKG